mmetsp:Transcript_12350/g.16976  ORF Transcript_12350/g.16976 Transcript_12350/m.16976 type:complete len:252 (+) Transcript_12350:24-779(+)
MFKFIFYLSLFYYVTSLVRIGKNWRGESRLTATKKQIDKLFQLVGKNAAAIIDLASSTNASICELDAVISANSNKTEDKLRKLIGYNENRDSELELLFLNILTEYLERENWEVSDVKVTDIYDTNGTVLMKWDGILFAEHPCNIEENTLFFLETKQLFTVSKFKYFKQRLEKLDGILASLDPKTKPADEKYIKVARRLTRYCRKGKFNIVGVLASPNIERGVLNSLENGDYYITLRDSSYEVKIFDSSQTL